MVKAYFSRKIPFYLMPLDAHADLTFDAFPVEVKESTLKFAVDMRNIVADMEQAFDENPAYEEAAQFEADFFAQLIGDGNNGE